MITPHHIRRTLYGRIASAHVKHTPYYNNLQSIASWAHHDQVKKIYPKDVRFLLFRVNVTYCHGQAWKGFGTHGPRNPWNPPSAVALQWIRVAVLNLIRQQTCAVNDGQHINLVLLYPINDTVRSHNQFTHILGVIFRHLAA